jgi:hypothetical protein
MSTEQFAIPICRHLKTNGTRCQSPSLQGETFCYFHLRLHKEHPSPLTARQIVDARNSLYGSYEEALIGAGEDPMQIARAYPNQNELNFPPLEDAESIQLAASMLFHAVSQGQVHLRRARILRDILRVANASCGRVKPTPESAHSVVREVERTPEGVTIARHDEALEPPAPEPSSQEPAPNEEFTRNCPEIKNLETASTATPAESGFCEVSHSAASTHGSADSHAPQSTRPADTSTSPASDTIENRASNCVSLLAFATVPTETCSVEYNQNRWNGPEISKCKPAWRNGSPRVSRRGY